jgi:hypothetical protein
MHNNGYITFLRKTTITQITTTYHDMTLILVYNLLDIQCETLKNLTIESAVQDRGSRVQYWRANRNTVLKRVWLES